MAKRPPSSINPNLGRRGPAPYHLDDLTAGVLAGDRVRLSRAVTLVESTLPEHRPLAEELLNRLLPHTGRSFRLGITGVPGVGKSTFIESFGLHLIREEGKKVAVLAVDPSSRVSGGSILGDKTRMSQLSVHPSAYVRPSPARESLGGVAQTSREVLLLCEAAGFDYLIVETVGVGQSETAVYDMVDCFLLLLLPGAGDELQGIKRGIVEMADLLAVNKADGEAMAKAREAKADYNRALHLFPPKASGWTPRAVLCSALTGEGVADLARQAEAFRQHVAANGYFADNRSRQNRHWLHQRIRQALMDRFYGRPDIQEQLQQLEEEVGRGRRTSLSAADELLRTFAFMDKSR